MTGEALEPGAENSRDRVSNMVILIFAQGLQIGVFDPALNAGRRVLDPERPSEDRRATQPLAPP